MVLSQEKGVSSIDSTVLGNRGTSTHRWSSQWPKRWQLGVVRRAHYMQFLTMMRAQLWSCMTGLMVMWDACKEYRSGWQCQQPHSLPLATVFPHPQTCPLRFHSLLAADIWWQKCCGGDVADKEKLLDTTDTNVRKGEPGRGSCTGDSERWMKEGSRNGASLHEGAVWGEPGGRTPLWGPWRIC